MYKHLLLAVDDSEQSARAAQAAAELAAVSGAEVTVFHAREHQDVVGKSGGSFDIETTEEADTVVDPVVKDLEGRGITVHTAMRHIPLGHVAKEIVKAAQDSGADTIVMGSHGRSGVGALVVGSNAYKVVHLADRAVLVVR